MSIRSLVIGACAVAAIAACVDSVEPLPLAIDLQASAVDVSVGDTISFPVSAQGDNLGTVTITYGDDGGDQFATVGARKASVTFRHAYSAAGSFRVRATVTDPRLVQRTDSVDVVVR